MKRFVLVLAVLFLTVSHVFAAEKIVVWNETARQYKRAPNAMEVSTGNVGFGTTLPPARLQIVGAGSGTGFMLRLQNQTSADKGVFLDNGNVGFGTTLPTARLQIVGAGSGTGYAIVVQNQTAANKVVVLDNGNVGIGTSTPGSALEVSGNITLGTHTQGALFIDDGTHIARLAPGTSGEFLKTQGAGADPIWSASDGKSNVVFSFGLGGGSATADQVGFIASDSPAAGNITVAAWGVSNGAYNTFLSTKYKHLASISTVTVYARIKGGSGAALYKAIIGSASAYTDAYNAAWAWENVVVDVSGLTPGTVYDVDFQLNSGAGYSTLIMCDSVIGIAD